MSNVVKTQTLQKNGVPTSSYSISPSSSSSSPSISSSGKISPAILFIIIIIAVIFFISGLLHLLVRFLNKQRSSLSSTNSESHNNNTGAFQRQLQQLFNLHDSGLDQSFIDSLPVFVYREITMVSKEPFDCAVCLCEFSEQDKLRLLPLCTHAFHIECIDTWLLSNSTCPLCRGTLYSPGSLLPVHENPVFYFEDPGEEGGFGDPLESQGSVGQKPSSQTTVGGGGGGGGEIHKRVFSVRLGKLRNVNVEASLGEREREREEVEEETSGLGSRRCFSMGSYQYVVGDSDLQVVALRQKKQANVVVGGESNSNNNNNGKNNMTILRGRGTNIININNNNNNNNCGSSKNSLVGDGNCSEGKKIMNIGGKGESFSQSKIWQWPRKGKFPSSSQESHLSNSDFSLGGGLTGLKFHEGI